uniref:Uncharacterized protein n=1 Tax=Magallana gigas TaxID=29159 RepID=K1QI75_MAGGI
MLSLLWCLEFFTISYAYVNIALNKPAYQQYQHYNPWNNVFNARNAVDGQKSNLTWQAGQCAVSANHRQTATWWVNLTSIHSIHHITIYFRTGNVEWNAANDYTGRVLGFSLYVSNTTDRLHGTLCYKDDNFTRDTIPDVFTATCPVHGQYVIYYNERLPGMTYPDGYSKYAFNDFCEVEVYECDDNYFGINCLQQCDSKCNGCNKTTGICDKGCQPGWVGASCQKECDPGFYGDNCTNANFDP